MTTYPMLARLLVTSLVALLATRGERTRTVVLAECTSEEDCSLNGYCVSGKCVCDSGWTNPPSCIDHIGGCSSGPPCSYFDLDASSPARPGYKNDSWPSWGGHPQFWSSDKGGDNRWHLFTAQFADECNVDKWVNNSFVSHSSAASPNGPWQFEDVAIYPWAHGPQIALATDGTWLLFFTGGWHTHPPNWANCSSPYKDHRPPPAVGPGFGPTGDGCGPAELGLNAGCGIRLATSHSPFGPWTIRNVSFSNSHKSKLLDCEFSNPAPWVDPNGDGSVYLAFGGGNCHGGLETIGMAKATHWSAPFALTSLDPIDTNYSNMRCPMGNLGEDPTLWHDGKRGFHIVAHSLCSWRLPWQNATKDLYALHAFSTDGAKWHITLENSSGLPAMPYSKRVSWTNGSSSYMSRMERPQLVLDPATNTKPMYLINAVCPGGYTVGGTACNGLPSWSLYRPINRREN